MAGRLRESHADLERKVEIRTHELAQSVGELRALGEVSQAVNSTLDLQEVLNTIVGKAVQLSDTDAGAIYEFEPSEEEILAELLPKNLAVQIYTALLENAASEQGARMTAMDNATRNAGEMIDRLTLNYNRTRQAVITKELIEIISGAEAL